MARQKGAAGKRSNGNSHNHVAENVADEPFVAYILSLSLENVRCFGPKQTLDLSDGNNKPARWTIILGLNGTGKTTLLQSIVGFQLLSNPPPIMSEWQASVVTTGSLRSITPSRFALWFHEGSPAFLRNNGENASSWEISYAMTLGQLDEHIVIPDQSVSLGNGSFHQSHTGFSPWCCAYGASRSVSMAYRPDTALSDDPTDTLFSDDAVLRNPEAWLLNLDHVAARADKNDKEPQDRLNQAKQLLLNILPDIEDIRIVTSRGPNPRLGVEFLSPYGWVPLRQLGYGYQTLITWVADLANRMVERYPDSPNPLAEPAVVLVDEIDLHLHPLWQRKLMSFLTERLPNTQFIATAHSPLVAQAAADANLVVLRREGDHVIIDNEVENIRNWRIDQILTSDLFGLKTARAPQFEAMFAERDKLLEKARLSAAEKRRLSELNAMVDEMPFGETKQEREERDTIKKALDALLKERKPAS